ncbi:replication-relaxation family protein [Paenibacillus naphthalenovorans]|uniref:replication-relaxation family protein n=1 Tax=Paenibacillus naphthalenovorans TaxID=162209 RepID=UPI003D26689F
MQSCNTLGFLTTSQIQRLHSLSGRRNALRILNAIQDEGYLNNFHEGELVWYLSAKGRREIGSEIVRKRSPLVQHTIMRNEVYVTYQPDVFKAEYPVRWDGRELVADAIFRKNGVYTFLEIDITQSMTANEKKIVAYRELRESGKWQAKYGAFPTVMFVTTSEHRRQKLRGLCGDLKAEVMTFNDIKP